MLLVRVTAVREHTAYYEVEFQTLEVLKGEIADSSIIVTGLGTLLCGFSYISVSGEYVLFVDELNEEATGKVSKARCQSFASNGPQARKDLQTLRQLSDPQAFVLPTEYPVQSCRKSETVSGSSTLLGSTVARIFARASHYPSPRLDTLRHGRSKRRH